mmetsp:Transcript_30876/g.89894  ORF Transcript_30876/g.89894 Transcript_30876/m.89894 type:complete len:280 (+) Transcript_30876:905-1744(+)
MSRKYSFDNCPLSSACMKSASKSFLSASLGSCRAATRIFSDSNASTLQERRNSWYTGFRAPWIDHAKPPAPPNGHGKSFSSVNALIEERMYSITHLWALSKAVAYSQAPPSMVFACSPKKIWVTLSMVKPKHRAWMSTASPAAAGFSNNLTNCLDLSKNTSPILFWKFALEKMFDAIFLCVIQPSPSSSEPIPWGIVKMPFPKNSRMKWKNTLPSPALDFEYLSKESLRKCLMHSGSRMARLTCVGSTLRPNILLTGNPAEASAQASWRRLRFLAIHAV